MVSRAPIVESTAMGTDEQLESNGPLLASYVSNRATVRDNLVASF